MKILYLDNGSLIDYLRGKPVGGGTASNYKLLEYLGNAEGLYVTVAGIYGNSRIADSKIKIISLNKKSLSRGFLRALSLKKTFKAFLVRYFQNNACDIVLATTDLISPAVGMAHKFGLRTVSLIRAFENLYECCDNKSLKKADLFISRKLFLYDDLRSLKSSDVVVTNSIFMQNYFKGLGIESEVVYPPLDYSTEEKTAAGINNIGIINPSPKKGYETVKKIAGIMKDKSFFYYGMEPADKYSVERKYDNIHFKGWKNNLSDIYNSVDLVLVPSLWEEPFGIIPVEAVACGVLPLVSERGGLSETVGNDSRLIIRNPENEREWLERIKYFDGSHELMNRIVSEKQEYIKKFSIAKQGEIFKELLENLCRTGPD